MGFYLKVVDRSVIQENLKTAETYLGEFGSVDQSLYQLQYALTTPMERAFSVRFSQTALF